MNTINRTEHFQLIGCAATGTGFRDSLSADYQKLFEDTFYEVGVEFQEKTNQICADWEKEMTEKYGLKRGPAEHELCNVDAPCQRTPQIAGDRRNKDQCDHRIISKIKQFNAPVEEKVQPLEGGETA